MTAVPGLSADIESMLLERGWAVVDLPDPSPVRSAREWLLTELRKSLPSLEALEKYHRIVDDERHISVVHDVAERFWAARYGHQVIAANVAFFRGLLGPDLHVQHYPYLRVVRPDHVEDAVPLHRDTYYGASPFEVSVVVPLTEMGRASALRAIPGSHVEPDSAYPFVQTESSDVAFGSARHKLGYAYAPRLLDPSLDARAEPIPVSVGQMLIFSLSLVHGGGANASEETRFSTDIRIVNSHAPVSFSRGVRADYYVPLCASPISVSASRFLAANRPAEPASSEAPS